MVMLFEEKTKIINLFVRTIGIQRLEMVECVVNGGQEWIVGVADLKWSTVVGISFFELSAIVGIQLLLKQFILK